MTTTSILRSFTVLGKSYTVMLDLEGKWRGMVHVFDDQADKTHNRDVVVSGARFAFELGVIVFTVDDVFHTDAPIPQILTEAGRVLSRAILN